MTPFKTESFHTIVGEIHSLNLGYKYKVNNGGCGAFARIIAPLLRDFGLDPVIMYEPDDSANRSQINRGIVTSPLHCWVNVKIGRYSYSIDAKSIWNGRQRGGEFEAVTVSEEYLNLAVERWHEWNRMFDRDMIPEIKKVITNIFEYEKKKID